MGTCAQPVVAKSSHNPLINLRIRLWQTVSLGNMSRNFEWCCKLFKRHFVLPHTWLRHTPLKCSHLTELRHIPFSYDTHHTQQSHTTFSYATPHLAPPQPRSAPPHHNYSISTTTPFSYAVRHTTLGYAAAHLATPQTKNQALFRHEQQARREFPGSQRTFFPPSSI